jgi:hypothetical protein
MLEKVMRKTWKMTPTWRQNGGRNPSNKHEKTIQKHITKNDAKIKRPKAPDPKGPQAPSARRGKEFLRRLQVKVPSCIQHPAKNKHPANN